MTTNTQMDVSVFSKDSDKDLPILTGKELKEAQRVMRAQFAKDLSKMRKELYKSGLYDDQVVKICNMWNDRIEKTVTDLETKSPSLVAKEFKEWHQKESRQDIADSAGIGNSMAAGTPEEIQEYLQKQSDRMDKNSGKPDDRNDLLVMGAAACMAGPAGIVMCGIMLAMLKYQDMSRKVKLEQATERIEKVQMEQNALDTANKMRVDELCNTMKNLQGRSNSTLGPKVVVPVEPKNNDISVIGL